MMFRTVFLAAITSLVWSGANAATVSHTGDFFKIDAPAIVNDDTPSSNDYILYYDEQQNVLLQKDLKTDQGIIKAGTRIDSHMFFLNRADKSRKLLTKSGSLTFATKILGTMSKKNGWNLLPSDFLGAPTIYTNFKNRGLENNGRRPDIMEVNGNTVTATIFNVTQPGDWVRVVTVAAVPLPAALPLMLIGFGGLGLIARRKARTA